MFSTIEHRVCNLKEEARRKSKASLQFALEILERDVEELKSHPLIVRCTKDELDDVYKKTLPRNSRDNKTKSKKPVLCEYN